MDKTLCKHEVLGKSVDGFPASFQTYKGDSEGAHIQVEPTFPEFSFQILSPARGVISYVQKPLLPVA